MYNQYRNNMSTPGNAYTLYLKPLDNGKYMIDIGANQIQITKDNYDRLLTLLNKDTLGYTDTGELERVMGNDSLGGSRRRRRPSSRKYKKSAKRVFRKKSRSTRRRWKNVVEIDSQYWKNKILRICIRDDKKDG